jgi:hypothetical protein
MSQSYSDAKWRLGPVTGVWQGSGSSVDINGEEKDPVIMYTRMNFA